MINDQATLRVAPGDWFHLAVMRGFLAKCLERHGWSAPPKTFSDLRNSLHLGVSELGPAEASRVFDQAAASWALLAGRCGFCGELPHAAGPMTCPILLEDGPDARR